jgi:drug/metabolite transporter (DMT)-like permease
MIFIIISTLLFGFLDSLWRPLILENGLGSVLVHRTLLTALFITVVFLFSQEVFIYNLKMICIAVISGAISFVGLLSLTKAFAREKTSSVVFLNVFTLLVGQITSYFLFGQEIPIVRYMLQITFAVLSIILINEGGIKLSKGILFALIASFSFGIAYPLLGIPISELGSLQSTMIQELTVLVFILLSFLVVGKVNIEIKLFCNSKILLLSICTTVSLILYFLAYNYLPVYKINLVANLYPVTALLSAAVLFKERLTTKQYVGIIIAFFTTITLFL